MPGPKKPKKSKPAAIAQHADLLDGLRSLGLTTVTAAQVTSVSEELYPSGTVGVDQGEVLRAVFLHLKRQNSADNVRAISAIISPVRRFRCPIRVQFVEISREEFGR